MILLYVWLYTMENQGHESGDFLFFNSYFWQP
jgi:hypothetical protein